MSIGEKKREFLKKREEKSEVFFPRSLLPGQKEKRERSASPSMIARKGGKVEGGGNPRASRFHSRKGKNHPVKRKEETPRKEKGLEEKKGREFPNGKRKGQKGKAPLPVRPPSQKEIGGGLKLVKGGGRAEILPRLCWEVKKCEKKGEGGAPL